MRNMEAERARMVESLAEQGITDELVLQAFRHVPREAFVDERLAPVAYVDAPLPIEEEQTISQPYIVAYTAEALALRGGERILDIGTGSGYAAAILSLIGADVYSVERIESLAISARDRLRKLGYHNVHVLLGDGSLGWPEHAPYDAIAVAAGSPQVPKALLSQLSIGGRLVIPVGRDLSSQMLLRVTRRTETDFRQERLAPVRFVPLLGEQGWGEGGLLASPEDPNRDMAFEQVLRAVGKHAIAPKTHLL